MAIKNKTAVALLSLRLSVFLVMLMWTIDKFVNPGHTIRVYDHFYPITGLGNFTVYLIGAIELVILFCFITGIKKRYSYGAVLAFHAVSTLSSLEIYLSPFNGSNLLFFAAWPMLAACLTLFLLRDQDRLMTLTTR